MQRIARSLLVLVIIAFLGMFLSWWPMAAESPSPLSMFRSGYEYPFTATLGAPIGGGLPLSYLQISDLKPGATALALQLQGSVAQLEDLLVRTAHEIAAPSSETGYYNSSSDNSNDRSSAQLYQSLRLSLDLWQFGQRREGSELALELGNIATLVANLDALTYILNYIIEQLQPGGLPLPKNGSPALVIDLENLELLPGLAIQGEGQFKLSENLNFYLDKLTLRISSGALTTETELDPQKLNITQEKLALTFKLGAIDVRSGITLGDQRVLQETIELSAEAGDLRLVSEATFTIESQEFRIGMTIGDLEISSTSVLTPTGLGQQIFSLEMEF